MKNVIGILLSIARHIINVVTILVAIAYFLIVTRWMHAPVLDVLQLTATIALFPLGLAWLSGRIGRHLRENTPLLPSSPAKRWLLTGVGLFMVAICATAFLTKLRQYECSVDKSRTAAARELQIRRDGFERVCEGDLARFDISLRSIESATRKLAFTPVDLQQTPFSKFESLGGRAEVIAEVASRLYRGFRTSDGHRIILSEHDMSADGSRTWRDPKDEPERINGLPARLRVLQDSSGAAISHLSWVEGRRSYELWIDANVITTPLREQLFALAASLPPSVPGCPNEVPPEPIRIGADGFPADEPMPMVLTQAEMDALFAKSKRPCK